MSGPSASCNWSGEIAWFAPVPIRIGDVAVPALREAPEQVVQSAAEQATGGAACEQASKTTTKPAATTTTTTKSAPQQIAEAPAAVRYGAGRDIARLIFGAAEHVSEPALALVGAIGEYAEKQSGQRRHAGALISAAEQTIKQSHYILLRSAHPY